MNEVKLHGLDEVLRMFETLPKAVTGKGGRDALRKGARVIRKQELLNLRAVTRNQTASGDRESTGLLAKNVVVSRGRPAAGIKGEKVLVRVRKKEYTVRPDGSGRSGKAVTNTVANAQRLEYGTNEQPAEPWIRPAFQAKAAEAIRTIERELGPAIEKAAAKALAKTKRSV
jgi:HK97 gp10 family phage protein